MESLRVNKRIFLHEFLKWWGIYFVFIIAFFLIHTIFSSGGPMGDISMVIMAAIVCTALGSWMAVSHYYFIYIKYWQRRSAIYLLLSICLIGLFILIDGVLFYLLKGGEHFLHDGLSRIIFGCFERVMVAYVPVVLIYAIVRNRQIYRKETKNR